MTVGVQFPFVLSLGWMFFNPVLFSRPQSTRNWASKGVLGERVYLNRDVIPLPEHHSLELLNLLKIIAGVGFFMALWGAIAYSLVAVLTGITLTYMGKSWFLDRMVWLYEDMKHQHDSYSAWEY